MNLKQLSLAALASMALFACSNDESLGGSDENGTPKAVYMKLEGISASAVNGRSTDAPTEDGNHTVTVSDVAVIFYQDGPGSHEGRPAHSLKGVTVDKYR